MWRRCGIVALAGALSLGGGSDLLAQDDGASLSIHLEELTAPDLVRALDRSSATVVIPLGILEKHGPHLPLGTDLLAARAVAERAAREEYVVVFPPYYFGQIFEARHQPGTMAYGSRLIWDLLQATCDELGRNGFRRIVLVNGHGGNDHFLHYFCQAQLARRRPYVVYLFEPAPDAEQQARIAALRKTTMEMHAGETESSMMAAIRPDLVHPERAKSQDGTDQHGLAALKDAYTGIWWYARFPNHYAGDGSAVSRELGELVLAGETEPLVRLLRVVKQDETAFELQERFQDQAERPWETAQ